MEIECVDCDGAGCEACNGSGLHAIEDCPQDCVRDLSDFFLLCDLCEAGMSPSGGGSLDQSRWFLLAYQRWRSDRSRILYGDRTE